MDTPDSSQNIFPLFTKLLWPYKLAYFSLDSYPTMRLVFFLTAKAIPRESRPFRYASVYHHLDHGYLGHQ